MSEETEPTEAEVETEAPKEKAIPKGIYGTWSGSGVYEHNGRSAYALKINGYRFQKGQYTFITHPQDVAYFLGKKFEKLSFVTKKPTGVPIVSQAATKEALEKYAIDVVRLKEHKGIRAEEQKAKTATAKALEMQHSSASERG